MQRAISDLTLELSRSCDGAAVTVKRGDTHRRLRIRLTQAGRPYPVDAGCSAVFTAVKPDGSHLFNACTVTDGAIYYDLTPQTTALPGELACEIRLYGENEALLTSAAFLLTVADTVYQDGDESVASSGEATELTRLINEADRKISELEAVLANEVNHAIIDDSALGTDAWSSKNIVDKLCPSFTESDSAVACEPVEGYPLEVVSALAPKADDSYHGVITLTQCGKNFYDKTKYPFSPKNWINQNTGDVVGGNNGYSCTVDYIPISHLRGKTITLNHTPGGSSPGMAFYDVNKTYISGKKGTAVVVPDTAVYMRFTVNDAYADGEDVQWEIGSVATAYEPYKGQTFTADLSEVGVAEGGYNWNTGVLINDSGEMWQHNLSNNTFTNIDTEDYNPLIVRSVPALPGTNTLYSDCGDTEVSGKADPVKIIEKLTNAILAQGGTV